MVRIAAVYPRIDGKSFNMDYYTKIHLPVVCQRFAPYGLSKIEVDKPLETPGGAQSPFFAIGYLYFPTLAHFQKAYASVGAEVIADISKYTDVKPMIQVGERVEI
ncbi:MAG: EthD family reductase [Candidatus Omnitrophica bacterium]|nr:EthD family reductase [Candidatus Omnitrophota bacterium]